MYEVVPLPVDLLKCEDKRVVMDRGKRIPSLCEDASDIEGVIRVGLVGVHSMGAFPFSFNGVDFTGVQVSGFEEPEEGSAHSSDVFEAEYKASAGSFYLDLLDEHWVA